MAVTAKDCYALTSYFVKRYKEHYGVDPKVNKFAARYGFDAMLQGMKKEEFSQINDLIDYYFTTKSEKAHNLQWFFNNYDKLWEAKTVLEEDKARRARLRKESEERARKWKERRDRGSNDRTTGN
jgi:hypothetical protein